MHKNKGRSNSHSTVEETQQFQVDSLSTEVLPTVNGQLDGHAACNVQPADGGWGWVVCFASFCTNGTIFGVMNCFGVLFLKLKESFSESHKEAAFLSSWVGSVSMGMTFLLSPIASILTDKFGVRKTAFVGGLLASLGMLLSSVVVQFEKLELLYLTYGVVLGTGASLAYTPSLVILGHYFRKRLGLVNGIVTAGSSVFTMAMPFLMRHLLDEHGFSVTLQVLAAMMTFVMICALVFRPVPFPTVSTRPVEETTKPKMKSLCRKLLNQIINVSIWKNKRYVLWVIAIPSALFGYFVPYVHLVQHVKDILPKENGETLLTFIGLTSGIGRIVFGKIADIPRINRIYLQQLSFVCIGILIMLLAVARNFTELRVICLLIGLFDGCFISLLGPIAFDIVGHDGASQAIGFLLGLCSIPLMVGPPIAGLLYDHLGNYTIAFLAAGVPQIIGAIFMFSIHRIRTPNSQNPTAAADSQGSSTQDDESQRLVKGDSHATAKHPSEALTKYYQNGSTSNISSGIAV